MNLLIVCQAVDRAHPNLGFFVRWIEEFAAHYDHVTVIANEVGEYTLPQNVTVFSLGKEQGVGRVMRYVRFYADILGFSSQYDHVFCHMNPEFVIAGGWWWRLIGKRIVLWYVHGTVSWRLKLALVFAHGACTTNEASLRIQSPKVHYVGHGIDVEYFKKGNDTAREVPLIVSVSRISPSKNIDRIVDAFEQVHAAGVRFRGVIIGGPGTPADAAYAGALEERIARVKYLTYAGPLDAAEVREALLHADIMVNSSSTGSMDKAVLEAMAMGVIPITTNVAFETLLGPIGFYVPHATADALAASIQKALLRTDRAEIGETLRAVVVRGHNLKTLVPKIIQTFS